MKQISIIIALALLTTFVNAQNIKGSQQVRGNDEVKKQQVENRSENRPLIYGFQEEKRVDRVGASHGGVPTPHVHEHGKVRPIREDEI